ncbi:hypothetical protein SAMN05216596_102735 [Pseudomonas congelans]|jgi:hypothetical protein|uniref:Uncharacterized protein n=1 Tax=Pseudomonas congelans TaxID=200452 RepID=A0A1H0PMQ7_9PSED|nr:hypothetical protein [Pseudomonas congelans]PBP96849.1 hypothetical protein CCL24_14175 [Pseudomonas congelans]PBQ08017.1 hypothetical protein CCL08_26075 [Pseudomonas congelans]PBQ16117.1 hypothetical protein CCL09_16725 [Pseudomonas congelans]SDP05935.1 hypothetical protein SAMN05216596_102735 [Pseudomonas congelans]
MEIKTKSATEQPSTYRPAFLERLTEPRSGRFASLLNDAITQTPPVAAPATLDSSTMLRSPRFMDSMSIEQRRAIVEEKDFVPMPTAMKRARRTFK